MSYNLCCYCVGWSRSYYRLFARWPSLPGRIRTGGHPQGKRGRRRPWHRHRRPRRLEEIRRQASGLLVLYPSSASSDPLFL
ncbi:unnamed protein product [Linum trigynum]|uniref:Uncharacterized protein n=1 Tax=Linum trigynum TaxID=586398 RepID=A0AAV2F011_9ROSI